MDKLVENLNRLNEFAVNSFDEKYPQCPVCGRILKDPDDIEFTEECGWCLMCDAEKVAQAKRDYDEVNRDIDDNDGLPERRFY